MNRQNAESLIYRAKELNNGAWINHSYNVANLAERIADKANMDSEKRMCSACFTISEE